MREEQFIELPQGTLIREKVVRCYHVRAGTIFRRLIGPVISFMAPEKAVFDDDPDQMGIESCMVHLRKRKAVGYDRLSEVLFAVGDDVGRVEE